MKKFTKKKWLMVNLIYHKIRVLWKYEKVGRRYIGHALNLYALHIKDTQIELIDIEHFFNTYRQWSAFKNFELW